MIRIKDIIFNENKILYIAESDDDELYITFENGYYIYVEATFDDIEWNYGTPQETQRQMQKELCKSCYYRDTVSNKLKKLKEETSEDKRIEKISLDDYVEFTTSGDIQRIDYMFNKNTNTFVDKINEIIDKINLKGGE